MTHTIYALCVWAKSTRALFSREWSAFIVSLFSVGKSSALGCPIFSRELRQSSAPRGSGLAAAEAVKRLSSRRSQMKLANEFEREKKKMIFSSRARQRLTRVNCGRKMYCLLHLLIQQEVLCWLMVRFPRCRAAGGYEACASAR